MKTILLTFLSFTFVCCAQQKRSSMTKENAVNELKVALSDKQQHNVVNEKTALLKTEKEAIEIAETILFSIYGTENILGQKPYDVYLIDNYWILSGTLKEEFIGGTFLIIINSKNAEVLKITHGK